MADRIGAEPFGAALGEEPSKTKSNIGARILDFLARAGGAGSMPEATLGGALRPEVTPESVDAIAGRAITPKPVRQVVTATRPKTGSPTLEQAAAAKTEKEKGGFNIVPAPKETTTTNKTTEKIGAETGSPRFVDVRFGAARKQDIIAPKEYTDIGNLISNLVEERRRFTPEGSRARARLSQEIADLSAQQRGIRTDIEKGIAEKTQATGQAKTVQERIKQIQDQAKSNFEREKFAIQESRLGAEARARIAASYEKAATAALGARPKKEEFESAEEFKARKTQYEDQRKRYLEALTGQKVEPEKEEKPKDEFTAFL